MKKLTIILIMALLLNVAVARDSGLVYHEVQVVDEVGAVVDDITTLYIYAPDTTTDAVIYMDRNLQNTITIPMTEASTNTTLVDGKFYWYGADGWDFSMTNTNGNGPMTNSGHRTRSSSEGRLVFPTYLQSISSTTYTDAQTITMGTGSDWVINGGGTADTLTFTPASDDSTVNIGTSGTTLNSNFNVYTGTLLGFKLASSGGTHSLTYDGGIANLNVNSNFATNINTGTSTGAINLGSGSSGAWAIDGTTTGAINADDSITMTVSAGTIGIAATGGDITIDGVDKSVIIRGTEAIADAIWIDADAGGIDITSAATFDIDLTATGGTVQVIATEAAANQFKVDAQGAVAGIAIQLETTSGGIHLLADHATNGDITLDAEDDIILTTTGALTITNTSAMTVSGALTVTGDTQLVSVTRIDTPIEIVAATNAIEITESGTVYVLNHATEFATTLPTVATSAGVTYRFIVGVAPDTGSFTILTDSLEDKISGSVVVNGAAVAADGPDDTITFTASAAVVGDWIELTSDGVLWYISGQGFAATGIVPSKAD